MTSQNIELSSSDTLHKFPHVRTIQFNVFYVKVKLGFRGATRRFGENYSPIFLCYDTDRIENYASNNSFLPWESLYRVVT
jgi:hypothetical protein